MESLLSGLNPQQRAAVLHDRGPLLVVAGPGTGKTRVITHRLGYRIATGTEPERLLGLTFTHRAAREMRERVRELTGLESEPGIGTFHWLGHLLLRRYADRLGFARGVRLLSPSEARAALRATSNSLSSQDLRRYATAISAVKNGESADQAGRRFHLDVGSVVALGRQYAATLRAAGAVDLDDLQWLVVRVLREHEDVRERLRRAYEEIVVDEYQDTNPIQQEILRLLVRDGGTIVAVGDEDQAIYGWRQAGSQSVRRFLEDFPDAGVVRLSESYRSTKLILRAAGTLIEHNPDRLGEPLIAVNPAGERPVCFAADDESDEAEWVAGEIARSVERGRHPDNIAVLYRTNVQSRPLEDALIRRQIPYHVVAGERFYERPEIRRAVAFLRLALGPDDAATSLLTSTITGIGPRRLAKLTGDRSQPLEDTWRSPPPFVPRGAAARMQDLAAHLDRLRANPNSTLASLVDVALAAIRPEIEAMGPADAEPAGENLLELASIAREFEARKAGVRDLVDRLSRSGVEDGGKGGVALMTLHATKGLEFDAVFLTGLEEGLLPHRRSMDRDTDIQEERRLCYVGMTRPRKALYLSYAHMRMMGGQASLGHASRFVSEIGPGNLSAEASRRGRTRPRLLGVEIGERVEHARWGVGTVTARDGSGQGAMATVEFDTVGRQRLQLCYAPLTRVERPHAAAG